MNIKQQILKELGEDSEDDKLNRIMDQLDNYQISPITAEATHQLIHKLKPVLAQERLGLIQGQRFRNIMADTCNKNNVPIILQLVGPQTALMGRWFIALTIAFLALGLILTNFFESSSSDFLVAVAPLLGLLTFLYEYRAQIYKVEEMESACRYSSVQIAAARILVVLGYNVLLCTVATLVIDYSYNVVVWKVILNWLAPLILVLGIALLMSLKLGIPGGCSVAAVVWLIQITLVERGSLLYLLLPNMTGFATDLASVLLGSGLIYLSLRLWQSEEKLV